MSATERRKLGLSSWFGYEIPLPERLALMKSVGFEATTLWWGDEQRDKLLLPKLVQDHGLELDHIHLPYDESNELWSDSADRRESTLRTYLRWVEEAASCGASMLVMHVTKGYTPPELSPEGITSFKILAQAAEEAGIVLALENTRRLDYLERLFSEIQSPSFGFCYDTSHAMLYNETVGQPLRIFGDRLLTTHLSDNDGKLDQHWLPGEGVIQWNEVADSFPAHYQGCVMLEVLKKEDSVMNAEDFVRTAYQKAAFLIELLSQSDKIWSAGLKRMDDRV